MQTRYEELKKRKGVRNADVTRGTGISASTLSEWKRGKYELKMEKIIALADYFGVTLDYFVLGRETETTEIEMLFNELNDDGKAMLLDRANELIQLGYIKNNNAQEVSA